MKVVRVMSRTGSEPRIRSCIFDTKEKKTSFLDAKYSSIELSGKGKHHLEPKESTEINLFRKKKIKNFPNSNRTLTPKQELITSSTKSISRCSSIQNMRSSPIFNPGSNNILISYQEPLGTQRKHIICDYNSKDSLKLTSEPSIVKTNYRRCIRQSEYSHNNSTSQIIHLPGGIKRDMNSINELNANTKYIRNSAFWSKIRNEYFSNVSCLPGRFTKVKQEYPQTGRQGNKYNRSDIFNVKDSVNKYESFNQPKRKASKSKSNECNAEREFMYDLGKKGKVQNKKINLFKSQIEII